MRNRLRAVLLLSFVIALSMPAEWRHVQVPALGAVASAALLYWLLKGDIGDLSDWKPLTLDGYGPPLVGLAMSTLLCAAIALCLAYGIEVHDLLVGLAACGVVTSLWVVVYAMRVGVVVYAKRHGIRWLL